MSDRRIRENVQVHRFLDLDLEVVLRARNGLADPEKWIQGHLGKGQRKCWAGHLLKAGARVGEELNRIALKLGFKNCSEMFQFNDAHTHAEVLARVDERISSWMGAYQDVGEGSSPASLLPKSPNTRSSLAP
jgi:sugar phosphate isomerase/epimerase